MAGFNGIDQYATLTNMTSGVRIRTHLTLTADFPNAVAGAQYLYDGRFGTGGTYVRMPDSSTAVQRSFVFPKISNVTQTNLDSTIAPSGTILDIDAYQGTENDTTYRLFANNTGTEAIAISVSLVEVYDSTNTTLLHSFDISSPSSSVINDTVGSGVLTLTGFTFGITITGPDTTTEGANTIATGTSLDTITIANLISGSYSAPQTIDAQTATTLDYVAESGVNLCSPGNPVAGVPLEPTVTAAGITPYVVQQEAE